MKNLKPKHEIENYYLVAGIAVMISWLIMALLTSITIHLYQKSDLGLFEGIVYFITLTYSLGLGLIIIIVLYLLEAINKREFDKESTSVKIAKDD